MAVNVYHTGFGPFYVCADDDAYSKYLLYAGDAYTLSYRKRTTGKWEEQPFAETFKANFDELISSQFCLAKNPDVPVEAAVLTEFKKFVPNLMFINIHPSPTEKNLIYNVLAETEDGAVRSVKITYQQNPNNEDEFSFGCTGRIGDSGDYSGFSVNNFPYGYAGTGGINYHTVVSYHIGFLVTNSDMTAGVQVQVYSAYSGTVANSMTIGAQFLSVNSSFLFNFLNAIETEGTDPLAPGGTSGPGGGDGTFDFSSTPIDYPGLPTIGAYATGFVNIYVPSAGDLRALSAYMWAGAFDVDNFRKIVADPMDAVMGLSILPVTAAQIGVTSSVLTIGNISTGLAMPHATSQYVSVDCGTVDILPKWGAYLDFAPYSKLQLYLPYIGFVDISPDDVMNGSIGVRYSIDILSGTCIAFVKCRDHVIYEFGGSCSCLCPVTEGQYKNGLFGVLDLISGVGQLVSSVGNAAGSVAGGGGSPGTIAASVGGAVSETINTVEGMAGTVISMVKPQIGRSGSVGGSAGLMSYQMPYLVLTIPHMCIPGDQNKYMGYPSFITMQMSSLAGYTEIYVTHLHNMSCTDTEIAEIISLLGSGVIF